jgi:hypothetical protein
LMVFFWVSTQCGKCLFLHLRSCDRAS